MSSNKSKVFLLIFIKKFIWRQKYILPHKQLKAPNSINLSISKMNKKRKRGLDTSYAKLVCFIFKNGLLYKKNSSRISLPLFVKRKYNQITISKTIRLLSKSMPAFSLSKQRFTIFILMRYVNI